MHIVNLSRRAARSSLAAAAVLAALVGAGSAQAQSRGGAVAQACAADVQTLCPGVQPGGGRILKCLAQNRTKVSDGCKQAAKSARAARS